MDYFREYFSKVVLWEMERMIDVFYKVHVQQNLDEQRKMNNLIHKMAMLKLK